MIKVFGSFLLIFIRICVGKDLRSNLNAEEIQTLESIREFNECLDEKLSSESKMVNPKADIHWYKFIRNHEHFENGILTENATSKAFELCHEIKTFSLPAWRYCASKCKEKNPVIASAALSYAESYLLPSCFEPVKFIQAQICLNVFELVEKFWTNHRNVMHKSSKADKIGSNGIICKHFVNIVSKYHIHLKECGWNDKSLTAMINNKIAHISNFYKLSFTPFESCNGVVLLNA
uniref:Uncharacterized protein n=1 Tax=Panagrolaimus sp. PS1159 TaxID=55785 RepID=A0AC35FRD8_9BILA